MVTKIGDKFGRLTVLAAAPSAPNYLKRWRCRCDCGGEAVVLQGALRNGQTASCGCLQRERTAVAAKQANMQHGESSNSLGKVTPEYRAWSGMIQRCHSPRHRSYKHYGARGIRVCDSWRRSYPNFLRDVGRRPSSSHSLDRIKNELGYEPGNVRWATDTQQNNNTRRNLRITARGETKTLAEWATKLGVPYYRLHSRLELGWAAEDIVGRNKTKAIKGKPIGR